MIFLSACAVIPMVMLFMSSITDNDVLISNGYSFFPEKFSLYAYEYIFKTGNSVIHAYGISIVLTAIGTVLSLILTTLLAYALSLIHILPVKKAFTEDCRPCRRPRRLHQVTGKLRISYDFSGRIRCV